MKNHNNIPFSACVSKEQMLRYVKNKADEKDFFEISSHLENCEYCAEAFNGLKQLPDYAALNSLPLLWQTKTGIKTPALKSGYFSKIFFGIFSAVIISVLFVLFNARKEIHKKKSTLSDKTGYAENSEKKKRDEIKTTSRADSENGSGYTGDISKNVTAEPEEIKIPASNEPNKMPEKEAFIFNEYAPTAPNILSRKRASVSKITYLENLKTIDYSKKYAVAQNRIDAMLNHVSPLYENKEDQMQVQMQTKKKVIVTSYEKALANGLFKYNHGYFERAIADFDLLLNYFPEDINCRFYKALCFESSGKFVEAENLFNTVLLNPDDSFYDEAKWHLTLTKINLEDFAEAKTLLKQMAAENSFYKSQALEKLKELK